MFLLRHFLFCPIVWRLSLNIHLKLFAARFSDSLTILVDSHEVTKNRKNSDHIINDTVCSKMKLLQPLENLIENQKIPLKNNIAKTIFFQRRKKLFEVTEAATGGVL